MKTPKLYNVLQTFKTFQDQLTHIGLSFILKDGKLVIYTSERKIGCNYHTKSTQICKRLQILLWNGYLFVTYPKYLRKYLMLINDIPKEKQVSMD